NNAGVAALGGISAIRVNPGLLPLEPEYSISAGYYWPVQGRNYYQGGIVDAVTSSKIAAGVSFTGFSDDYEKDPFERDSPINRRVAIGVAHAFKKVSLGISGQYVNGFGLDEDGIDFVE